MEEKQPPTEEDASKQSLESLDAPDELSAPEQPETDSDAGGGDGANAATGGELATPDAPKADKTANKPKKPRRLFSVANLYLLAFILIVAAALGVVAIAYQKSQKQNKPQQQLPSQNLSPQALKQLATSNTNVGSSDQLLTVESNSIFSGQVLAQKNLEVAGNVKVGGNLSLPNIAVSGTGQFNDAQVNGNLSVAGNGAVQGSLSVKGSLSASGGNFSGGLNAPQITVNSLQLNGDLVLTHHIEAGGGTPGIARGSAVGSGGSASLSGSDTAGSVNISTGGSPPAGCFATISFTQGFNSTPHIIITPVGASAGGLAYYINRSSTSFSICDASPPPANTQFGFDYIAFD